MASRDLESAVVSEIEGSNLQPIVFFEGEFADGYLRIWTGVGEITWNGEQWQGAGSLLGIDVIQESFDVTAQGIRVSLSGIPTELVSLVLSNVRQNKQGSIWVGFLDDSGAIIANPALAFVGRLDASNLSDDGAQVTISVSYESKLRDLQRPRDFRYTPESQAVIYPLDEGFKYVAGLQDWNGKWGQA